LGPCLQEDGLERGHSDYDAQRAIILAGVRHSVIVRAQQQCGSASGALDAAVHVAQHVDPRAQAGLLHPGFQLRARRPAREDPPSALPCTTGSPQRAGPHQRRRTLVSGAQERPDEAAGRVAHRSQRIQVRDRLVQEQSSQRAAICQACTQSIRVACASPAQTAGKGMLGQAGSTSSPCCVESAALFKQAVATIRRHSVRLRPHRRPRRAVMLCALRRH